MIITYTQGRPTNVVLGKGWEARRWRKNTDTEVLAILWQTIIAAQKEKEFKELIELIKETYKNKTVRSRVEIYYENDYIEIIKRGVFPSILILKDK